MKHTKTVRKTNSTQISRLGSLVRVEIYTETQNRIRQCMRILTEPKQTTRFSFFSSLEIYIKISHLNRLYRLTSCGKPEYKVAFLITEENTIYTFPYIQNTKNLTMYLITQTDKI